MALIAHTKTVGNATSGALNTTGAKLLVVVCSCDRAEALPTISDSAGNTYIGLTAQLESSFPACRIYYRWNPGTSPTHTFTATIAGGSGVHVNFVLVFDAVQVTPDPFLSENGAVTSVASSLQTGSVSYTPGD